MQNIIHQLTYHIPYLSHLCINNIFTISRYTLLRQSGMLLHHLLRIYISHSKYTTHLLATSTFHTISHLLQSIHKRYSTTSTTNHINHSTPNLVVIQQPMSADSISSTCSATTLFLLNYSNLKLSINHTSHCCYTLANLHYPLQSYSFFSTFPLHAQFTLHYTTQRKG